MFASLEIFRMAFDMATHASARQSVIARNIANADTPGYKARDLPSFAETYDDFTGELSLRTSRAEHLTSAQTPAAEVMRDMPSSPNGNSVSIETEMAKATEAKGRHETALAIYKSSLDILRSSIGRR